MKDIIEQLREVWGRHDEFRENGIPYVCWVLQRQLDEMEEDNYYSLNCIKEFCDIILVCVRQLDEMEVNVKDEVLARLNNRMRGHTNAIIAREAEAWKVQSSVTKVNNDASKEE